MHNATTFSSEENHKPESESNQSPIVSRVSTMVDIELEGAESEKAGGL